MLTQVWYLSRAVRTFFSLLLGTSVFAVAYLYVCKLMECHRIWVGFIIVWIIVGLIQLSPFHGIVDIALKIIMSRSYSAYTGYRGIAILANEPSYAGIYIVFFMIITDIFYKKHYLSLKQKNIMQLILIGLAIFTKAGNSLFLLCIYFVINVLFLYTKKQKIIILILCGVSVIILFSVINELSEFSRAFSLVKLLFENPEIILMDQSIASRMGFMLIGFYGLISSHGLGNGLGSYSYNYQYLAEVLNLTEVYDIKLALGRNALLTSWSLLGGIAHDFGVLGLFIMLYIIMKPLCSKIDTVNKKFVWIIILNTGLLWVQACSYALPMPWFFLGIAYGLANKKITLVNNQYKL
jgi:hypothetical protein